VKVIGAGFGRTGTMSLKVALEELGAGPCLHSMESLAGGAQAPVRSSLWEQVLSGQPIDWRGNRCLRNDEETGSYHVHQRRDWTRPRRGGANQGF